jgi:hypothetical protein
MKNIKIFLMLFIAISVLSIIGSASAANDNITNTAINSSSSAADNNTSTINNINIKSAADSNSSLTQTILTVSNVTGGQNSTVQIKSTLYDEDGNYLCCVPVEIYVNSTDIGTIDIVQGHGKIDYSLNLTLGTYDITALYAGNTDDGYANSTAIGTLTVLSNTVTSLTVTNVTGVYNNTMNLTGKLTDNNGNAISGKTVTFTVNNINAGNTVTDINGTATLNYLINLTPGIYEFTAVYTVDQNYTTSNSTGTLTVLINPTKLTVSNVKGVYNNIVNLTAKLSDNNGKLVSGKTVSFTLNGIKIGNAVTNSNGVATLKYTLKQTPGTYKIKAIFAGNENYTTFNINATLNVLINPTKLAVSNVKGVHKHTVNLTAKLSDNNGKPVSGKTVSFTLNGIKIGNAVTNSNGVATLKYTLKQTRGAYKIKAIYTGNKNYKATNTTSTLKVL